MRAPILAGIANQVKRESGTWWSTRRWWVQCIVWTGLTNGLLAMMLWVVPELDAVPGVGDMTISDSAIQFAGMAALLSSIGVVVIAQGILIDERRSGVLEWMLSKPLSRPALILAKFAGTAPALVIVLVLMPWLGVLAQLSAASGSLWPVGRWLGAVMLVGLLALFHLALVLALSAMTWSRALVVAVPLAGIIGTDLIAANVPSAFDLLPWSLARLTGPVLVDGTLAATGPIISTAVLTSLCLVTAVWGLLRTEL